MAFPDRRTLSVLLTALLFVLVCLALYSSRQILLIFVLAIFFAYLIEPVVRFLQNHSLFFRDLRGPAVVEVYLALIIVIALAGYEFVPGLSRRTTKLLDEAPVVLNRLSTGDIASDLRREYGWSQEQEIRFRAFLARHKEDIQNLVPTIDRYLSNTAQILGSLLLVPVLAIFFLRDGDYIAGILVRLLFPANRRPRVWAIAYDLHAMLARYIRAQLILCGLSFLFYTAALFLLGFPHAVALAILGGLLEFVPAAGWISTFAVIVGMGVLNHLHWIWMALLLGLWRVFQDYLAMPRVMGSQLKIHPLAAIFAVLVGAKLGGIVGIYLAIPVMASMRVILMGAGDRQEQGPGGHGEPVRAVAPVLAETASS